MGGLARRMPVTYWTFLVGTLALCGVPPLSGFFSKDAILARAWEHQAYLLFGLGVFVAALTTLYMFRLVFVAFTGPAKSQAPDQAHESPAVMTVPLLALAVPSALAGFWGWDVRLAQQYSAAEVPVGTWIHQLAEPFAHAPVAAWAGLVAVGAGFALAWMLYRGAVLDPLPSRLGAVARWMRERFYFDALYARLVASTQDAAARLVDLADRWVLAGAVVKGTHGTVELLGRLLRRVQTGSLQVYAILFAAGVVVVLFLMNQR